MSEPTTPKAAKLEAILTNLHAQLYLMRSQVAAWQASSAVSPSMNHADEKMEQAFSLMEQCCQMDWEIGQSLLAMLRNVCAGEQKHSASPNPLGTPSPMLSKSLPNAARHRHPSSLVTAASSTLTAN